MDARTYRVKDLAEALDLIRRELGPNAALLHTRRVRRRSLGGLLGATELEVTAAADHSLPSRVDEEYLRQWGVEHDEALDEGDEVFDSESMSQPSVSERLEASVDSAVTLEWSSQAAQQSLNHAAATPTAPQPTPVPWNTPRYSQPEVKSSPSAMRGSSPSSASARSSVQRSSVPSHSNLRFCGPLAWEAGRSHWVALVGPTGVGKTTTLAKLAAEYRLNQKLEIGLVSLDTYRVNGAAHLHTYADILQLPLEVVDSPEQMKAVAASLTERYDIVLLDTGGQGPRDHEQRRRLKNLLEIARPDEVLLTLSATSSQSVWRDSVHRFHELSPTGLIVTKLDETVSERYLVDEIEHSQLPLSYLTMGQQVPQDILLATEQTAYDWLIAPSSAAAWQKEAA